MAHDELSNKEMGSKAYLAKKGRKKGKKGVRKIGRNRAKCAAYRIRVGKPNGPGKSGNKAGKNKG